MAYNYSDLDNRNLRWFPNDSTRATLHAIKIHRGNFRGLENIQVDFRYPITAIAGRNGSGKTTILALAACAYHNSSRGFRLPHRKYPYYTYSDFFMNTGDERPLGGIQIDYLLHFNRWHSPGDPSGRTGVKWQSRWKAQGGRWTNYDSRVPRTVVYLGIDRIVPHAERSVSRSYRRMFRPAGARGWEPDVKAVVGRILCTDYESFGHNQHSRYRIPMVRRHATTYSGFNMGAGEEALFDLFSIAHVCPDGSMIVVDEIELGLHEEAQGRLVQELKQLCEARHFQFIFTTHSPRVLECLPPEGRIFLERVGRRTYVIPAISPMYATGKLSGRPTVELDVLVEDQTARLMVQLSLPFETRTRVRVLPIGSDTAVIRSLASRYRENRRQGVCVILDGDKRSAKTQSLREFRASLESRAVGEEAEPWADERIDYLPGSDWPELWIVTQRDEVFLSALAECFKVTTDKTVEVLESARRAGKHNEFYEASVILNVDPGHIAHQMVSAVLASAEEERTRIHDFVRRFLE